MDNREIVQENNQVIVSENLQQFPIIAVVPFNATLGVADAEANKIMRAFFIKLRNTKVFSLVDGIIVERTLREQNFQYDDCSNSTKAVELGEALNADWIICGQIEKREGNTNVTVSFYNTKTSQFNGFTDVCLTNISKVDEQMDSIVDKFFEAIKNSGRFIARLDGSKQAQIYQIKDTIHPWRMVFYDKGLISDGWRYLEVVPVEKEFEFIEWGPKKRRIRDTSYSIGSGKKNTELIVNRFDSLRERCTAAQVCATLDFDGFNDWFLPSAEELDLMYKNLKQNGLGGFSKQLYWSSTESDMEHAWAQSFNDGLYNFHYKTSPYRVRAIRMF